MAETIRIEIPVNVVDNTGSGTSSVTRNLTAMERAFERADRAAQRFQRRSGVAAEIEIGADDNATPVLSAVENATEQIDGETAQVEVAADDSATQTVNAASDAVENFDGTSGNAERGADDSATPVVSAASDAVENFDGMNGDAEIGASDEATPVIRAAQDAAESWGGSVFNATIGVIDAATAPISALASAAKNPVVQGASLIGASFGVAESVNSFQDFESMMSQVKAISGATGQEFDDLTAKAQEMGATTKFTATESAEAFNYMAMAGWKPQQMIDGISGIMSLAAASGEDLGTTSDIVTDALTAFGLQAGDAGHFADVLAQASANANTNVSMLGESFKYVAPVAGAMNYSVEDTSLALGLMANASIKGSMAGTALKTSLANMAAPTDSMAAAMDKYGISLTDSEGNMKSLRGVIDNLRGSLGGLSETEQTAAASTIFGKEAMAGMLAIINASEEDYNKLSTAIGNSKDAAEGMADTMLDNLKGSFTLMQSAIEGTENAFGKRLSPYLRDIAGGIADAMPGITDGINAVMDVVDDKIAGVKRKISELESRTFAAHIHVQTYLGGTEDGQTLAQNIKEWARADNLELSDLSSQLSQKVSEALKDGIIDVNEEEAISALQEKMNNITARWKEAEAQAQWDWIKQEYGHMSAADLESGSFTDLMDEMRSQRETAMESIKADTTQWYSELEAMKEYGRITPEQYESYKEQTGWYVRGQQGSELAKSLELGSNTLNDTYGEKITGNIQTLTETAQNALKSAETSLQSGAYGTIASTFDNMFTSMDNGKGFLGIGANADQRALNELYQSMAPDVSQMGSLIDQYREAGQAVPQSLMDGYKEAIEVGAAAGDVDAAWQNYANQILESGSEEMKSVLTDPNNPMYESVREQLPDELRTAIDRATAETTTDEITLEGLRAAVDGDVDIDKDSWVSAMNEKLGDLATTEEVTAEGAKIKIEAGDCLWDIGNALGVDWHKIAEENGIEEPYIIQPGDEITISMDTLKAEVNGDAAQSAIEQAMSALTTEGAKFSVTAEGVKVDLSNVEVDSESATAQIESALGMESGTLAANGIEVQAGATVTIPQELVQVDTSGIQSATAEQTETEPVETNTTANVNITDATTDASGAKEQAQSEVESTFSESMPTDGHTDVTLDQTNNAAEVYSEVAGEVQSTFSNPIPASCTVNVTLDWHITNPSAGITTSGRGSSVTATIAGNAEGSIVTDPLLSWVGEDGPEAIIPLGSKRRDRGMDLWLQAGRALGVREYADGGMIGDVPLSGGSSDSTSGDSSGSGDKGQVVINMNPVFNINGDSGNDTVNTIKEKLKELINEMSGELATRLLDSYANMPT